LKVDWADATDWCLKDPHNYTACKLISEDAGIELSVARSLEKVVAAPSHAEAFDYPVSFQYPGMKRAQPTEAGVGVPVGLRAGLALPEQ
jgi:hypothetical protein